MGKGLTSRKLHRKYATDTSTRSTSSPNRYKREKRRANGKRSVQLRVQPFRKHENVLQDDVAIACRPFGFRPQKRVLPFLRVVRRMGLGVNGVLNDALVFYFDAFAEDGRLRDDARLAVLLKEERRLIQLNKVLLRSGAYLNSYATKVLKGGSREDAKLGRRPLAALAPDEVTTFKRMIATREAIVTEIREILARRLPEHEYVLKGEGPVKRKSQLRRRDKNKKQAGGNRAATNPTDSASLGGAD